MSGLMPRQARFVEEYMKDANPIQAAIRAGYSAKSAYKQGPLLLRNAKVVEALRPRLECQIESLAVTGSGTIAALQTWVSRVRAAGP